MSGNYSGGMTQQCYDSINKSDFNLHKNFYGCIVLSGSTTMLKGLPERFTMEMKSLHLKV